MNAPLIYLDTETYYPWPATASAENIPQPESADPGVLRRRQNRKQAHPWAKDPRRCALRFLTIKIGDQVRIHDMFTGPIPQELRDLLATGPICCHNADFDLPVLLRYDLDLAFEIFDTLIAARLLGLGLSKESLTYLNGVEGLEIFMEDVNPADNALDTVAARYLDEKIPKEISRLGGFDWSRRDLGPLHYQYATWDVEHLPRLREVLTKQLIDNQLYDTFRERMEFVPNLITIKMAGVPVDRERCSLGREQTLKAKESVREEIRTLFSFYRPEVPKSRRKKIKVSKGDGAASKLTAPVIETEDFNPHVSAQVITALSMCGIEVENAQRKTLDRIDRLETQLLVRYSLIKTKLNHINGICRSIFTDGRVRTANWNQLAAVSGRIVSNSPNLQNVPKSWRYAFEAPPGYQWLCVDLSQIEVVITALHTNCTALIELLLAGKDVYVETIARILGLKPIRGTGLDEVTDTLREVGKKLVLGTDYGLTIYGFVRQVEYATGIKYSLDEAGRFFEVFFAMYPEICAYHHQCEAEAHTATEVRTITGQRRFLPPLKDDCDPQAGYWPSLEFRKRVLLNTPIQALCAVLMIRSVNRFMPLIPTEVELVNLVHDEVCAITPPEKARETVRIISAAFETEWRRLYDDRLPIQLKAKLGGNWAETK
jgi:DNA polymerase-1